MYMKRAGGISTLDAARVVPSLLALIVVARDEAELRGKGRRDFDLVSRGSN